MKLLQRDKRGSFDDSPEWKAIALCAFAVAAAFLGSIAGIRHVTLDDRWYAAWVWNDSWLQSAVDTALQQGRLLKLSSFTMFFPYLVDGRLWFALFHLGSIAAAAVLAGLLFRRTLRSTGGGFLYLILFFALAQNSQDHNLFVAYPFAWEFSWICWMAGLYALIVALERGSLAIALSGAVVWLIGLQEGFVPHTVILVVVALCSKDQAGRRWRYLMPYLGGLLLWGILWILWRAWNPSSYEGSKIATGGTVSDVLFTWVYFSLGGMPMATIINGRSMLSAQLILDSFDALAFIKMAAVFLGVVWISRNLSRDSAVLRMRTMLVMAGCLVALALLPNLALSLTPKYQEWMRFGVRAYLYSHFSYFAWIGLGTLLVTAIVSRWRSRALVFGLALSASLASLVTDASNHVINREQRSLGMRWDSMFAFAASEEFGKLPEGTRIYFSDKSVTGTERGDAEYWRYVLRARTGKSLDLSPDAESFRGGGRGAYYLYMYDEPRTTNRYLVFAALDEASGSTELLARKLKIFPASENVRLEVGGALHCQATPCLASVVANGKPATGLFGQSFAISASYQRDVSGVAITNIESSEPVDLRSVWVDFARNTRTPESPVRIVADENFLGWQETDGVQYNWAGTDATLDLENTTGREFPVEVELWLVAGDQRSVSISDSYGRQLARVQLDTQSQGYVKLQVLAQSGPTKLHLHSEKPALYPVGPKGMAYQLRDLGLRKDGQIAFRGFD